ncbi:MAG: hypothetical protein SVG88_10490 [Halobacteriales archaeon]|nr:hypothetical protein [Halobacteriales archaeon]
MERAVAIDRIETILETIDTEVMPVPIREVWVYGDIALGLDPIDRLNVYLTKDLLLRDAPEREAEFVDRHGIKGVGKTVRAEWAEQYPDYLRANANGHAAPEQCLAAHLLPEDDPIHLEICNTGFEDNVTQRLQGAQARDAYEEILDPRGVCLWIDGQHSEDALRKLRNGELVLPTLTDALGMLGLDEEEAEQAATTLKEYREGQSGATVRGDVI